MPRHARHGGRLTVTYLSDLLTWGPLLKRRSTAMSYVEDPAVTYPPEPKVIASTAAATAVGFLLDAIVNIAQNSDTGALLQSLPDAVEPFVVALVLAVPTWVAGYRAKHQHRREGAPIPPEAV